MLRVKERERVLCLRLIRKNDHYMYVCVFETRLAMMSTSEMPMINRSGSSISLIQNSSIAGARSELRDAVVKNMGGSYSNTYKEKPRAGISRG